MEYLNKDALKTLIDLTKSGLKEITDNLTTEATTRQTKDSTLEGLITNLTTRLNTLADSDDTTLDQLSEIVAYIKDNRTLIEGVTTSKVSVTDIVDSLESASTTKPLAARQGSVLDGKISDEVERATSAEETLTINLKAEKTRAEEAESANASAISSEVTRAKTAEEKNSAAIADHISDKENPHSVTKTQVGLGNVDNTSDANKPVSTAQQEALNKKVDKATGKSLVSDTEIIKLEGLSDQDTIDNAIADAKKAGTDAQSALATEITRAKAAESTLASNITSGDTAALNSAKEYADAIATSASEALDAEVTRAKAAEEALNTRITNIETWATIE